MVVQKEHTRSASDGVILATLNDLLHTRGLVMSGGGGMSSVGIPFHWEVNISQKVKITMGGDGGTQCVDRKLIVKMAKRAAIVSECHQLLHIATVWMIEEV